MTKSPSNLTNEMVREIFTEFYNKWFLPYSKKAEITYNDLDTMYDRGKELVEKYQDDMALHLFVDLFKVIEGRRTA